MRNIDNLTFGDIALAEFPFSNGSRSKLRPVLILSKDRNDYLFMKISSVVEKKEHFDLIISSDTSNNLLNTSVFKVKKISSFSKEILFKKIGKLSPKHCKDTKDHLNAFIDQL